MDGNNDSTCGHCRFRNNFFEKALQLWSRNGALDITFDTIPAIDGTEFTAVHKVKAKDKTRSEVKAAGASVAGAVLLGPVSL